MPTIRLAVEGDAEQVRAIYAPYCEADSPVSFEVEPPPVEEIGRRIARTLARFPWLVCDDGGEVLGYAYAGPHAERAGYAWSVNASAYTKGGRRRSGVGRALYTSLFAALRVQGFVNVYAGITLPNPASVGLHRAMGFTMIGVYQGVGHKCGAWQDTSWWERALRDRPGRPVAPLALPEARALPDWGPALAAGLAFLKT